METLPLWLYRTVGQDSDATPFDFGAVRAADREAAAEAVAAYLTRLGAEGEDFYIYTLADVTSGVLPPDDARGGRTLYRGR